MKTRRVLIALMVVPVLTAFPAAGAQIDQNGLAQRLLSDDIDERSRALNAVRTIPAGNVGRDLRAALIALLANGNKVVRDVTRRGEIVEHHLNPEFHARVCQTVAELRHPGTIPVLADSLGTCGWMVYRYLAPFGEQAAPAVLTVVTSTGSSYEAVSEGLIALRFTVENSQLRPLSEATVNKIRAATAQRLTGKQYFPVVWRAIDLAIVLGDPGLKKVVESLAADQQAVFARGVVEPDLIERTQQLARERLAGVPPLPRQ